MNCEKRLNLSLMYSRTALKEILVGFELSVETLFE